MKKTVIKNIKGLVQVHEQTPVIRSGIQMSVLPVLENSFLEITDGKISNYGDMSNYRQGNSMEEIYDADGRFVFPCWVDSHTHIVNAGSREMEFVMKIKGASYEEIYEKGGGILNSVKVLRQTSEDVLYEQALIRLDEMIRLGTGAVEIKSGYGLSLEAELKMLRVIKKLKEKSPVPIRSTFLGAHAFPLEYRENREGYISEIIDGMIPAVASESLADYIDVFCDKGFYSPEETGRILEAGAKYGLKPKIHANELDFSGGVQVGVKHKALSVDHLEVTAGEEIRVLLNSSTIPTVLPSTSFFLGIPFAPAREMIDKGLAVCIASDYNPGSSPSGNLNFSISLACIKMKLLPEEAINAASINAAYALELQDKAGYIAKGIPANIFITKPIPSIHYLPYSFGNHVIDRVMINGKFYEGMK